MLILGVDSSTQSTKVELRELDSGTVVAVGRGRHPTTTPPRSEQDPQAWWDALVEATHQLDHPLDGVVAMAVAGQQHGLVVLDELGEPLRPAKLWNDTESAPEAEALVAALGPAGWANACGSVPTASFTITKLAWLATHEADLLPRVASVLLPHDYLTWRLTGHRVTDRGDASGTGWWSPAADSYEDSLLDLVSAGRDLRSLLPRVLGPTEAAGTLTAAAARELGLDTGVLVGPGTGDNMAGALGLGLAAGDVALSIGTSGTVYGVSEVPTHDPEGKVAGFADASGRHLPLVCTLNATKVTDSIGRLLGRAPGAMSELALTAPAGAGGVVVVPYFDGERTPNLPAATGSVVGLRSDIEPNQLARAAYEGVACGLLEGLDALVDAGVATGGRWFLIGGGARSAAYQRTLADLGGAPLLVPEAEETVATGACVQAAAVYDQSEPNGVARRWGLGAGPVVEPDESVDAATIRGRYAQQVRRLY